MTEVVDRGYLNSSYTSQTTGDMIVGATLAPVAMAGIVVATIVPSLATSDFESFSPEDEKAANVEEVENL